MTTPNEAAHVADLERKVAELTAENASLQGTIRLLHDANIKQQATQTAAWIGHINETPGISG